MSLLHIEGFDVINSEAKSALVGIDMSHQGSITATSTFSSLRTFNSTGRYTGSTALALNYRKATHTITDDDGTETRYGNIGTWSRIPFAEQQSLGSFTFGFSFKTSSLGPDGSLETCIASIADNNGNPLLLLTYNASGYLNAYLFNNTNATYTTTFRGGHAQSPTATIVSSSVSREQRNFVQNEYVNAGGSTTDHSPLGTGSAQLAIDTFYTIECQVIENSSKNYSIEVRLDDVIQIDSNNNAVPDNQCANLHEVILLNAVLEDHAYDSIQIDKEFTHTFDDFYFLDDAGSVNNTFLGSNTRIQGLPLGAANTSIDHNFSVSTGTVGGNLADFDTNTVATLSNPGIGVFDIADPETVLSGNGIRYIATAKFATGDTNLEFLSRIGSTNYSVSGPLHDGSPIALTSTFNTYQEIQELNPATSSAYTESEIDALQVGLKAS